MSIGNIISVLVLAAFSGFVIWVVVILVLFNIRRRRVERIAGEITPEQLSVIYELIESTGDSPHNGYILVRTNKPASDEEMNIQIPNDIEDFPWAGKYLAISKDKYSSLKFSNESSGPTRFRGNEYTAIQVPRKTAKSGKARNAFDPITYLKRSPELKKELEGIYPSNPFELLSYLLNGRIEFDPIFQARIGTSASWIQYAEFPKCPECKQSMALIAQIPCELNPGKNTPKGTAYFFGCKRHPESTCNLHQNT